MPHISDKQGGLRHASQIDHDYIIANMRKSIYFIQTQPYLIFLDKVAGRHHPRDQSICKRDIHLLVGSSQGKLKRDIVVSTYLFNKTV